LFQLTINVSAVLIAFIGPLLGLAGGLPLTIIQMLWINLVMDTLAALAFSGEPPLKRYMLEKPKDRAENIISKPMWNSILFNGLLVTSVSVFFLSSDFIKSLFRSSPNDIVFLAAFFSFYAFMNFFNMFNARTEKANIFDKIKHNYGFIRVALLIVAVQIVLTLVGGRVFRTTGLTLHEWTIILGMAVLIIPLNMLRKTIFR